MNIFGVGFAELVLIFVIMLIVAGPKRMIRWAFVIGQYLGKLRRMWEEMVDVMQAEADAAGLEITIPKELPNKQNLTKLVVDAVKPYSDELKKPLEELQAPIAATAAEANTLLKDQPEKTEQPKDDLGTWQNQETNSFGSWGQSKEADNGTGRA